MLAHGMSTVHDCDLFIIFVLTLRSQKNEICIELQEKSFFSLVRKAAMENVNKHLASVHRNHKFLVFVRDFGTFH